ncbi:MAG: hypothetical protein FWF84_03055, partial [Kiritimatiellaeota bacterium]|nr:hypothetical protein [Kiritimatiellota bacterium]
AAEIEEQHAAWIKKAAGERAAQAERITSEVYIILNARGLAMAHQKMEALAAENPDTAEEESVATLRSILTEAVAAEKNVVRSVAEQMGKVVTFGMKTGAVSGMVVDVDEERGTFNLAQTRGTATVNLEQSVANFALAERLQRMGQGDTPGLRFARALAALDAQRYDIAREQIAPLSNSLKRHVLQRIPLGN